MRVARCFLPGLAWLAFPLIPAIRCATRAEVSIRSAAYSPPPPRIAAQSNLVESGVTVYDARGRAAGGFTAADFTLSDNGKPQPITVFSEFRRSREPEQAASNRNDQIRSAGPPSAPARNLALFFDDLHLTGSGLPLYRKAAEKLINTGLRPGERMGIFTDSGTVTVDFTTDTSALLAALPRIKTHGDPAARRMTVCPTLTDYSAFVITNHIDEGEKDAAVHEVMGCMRLSYEDVLGVVMDMAAAIWNNSRHYSTNVLEILKMVVAHLGKQNGDRVLVMVSGGFPDDGAMKNEIQAVLDDAVRRHITINSVAVESRMGYRQLLLTNTMVDAASATGGRVIKNANDLDGALSTLASPPEVSYLLGFQAGDPDGKYHSLRIGLRNQSGFKVESRPGYFAALPPKADATAQQRIDNAIRSNTVAPGRSRFRARHSECSAGRRL